jgi:hypothetical protein
LPEKFQWASPTTKQSPGDWKKTVRRNKLLGMWRRKNWAIKDAAAYADALAVGTLDPKRSDVFSRVRADFDAAGVVQADEQIRRRTYARSRDSDAGNARRCIGCLDRSACASTQIGMSLGAPD